MYDADKVYFTFEVPGPYRFDLVDNHLCASISTMMKMGEKATLFNMGGCPMAGNCEVAPEGKSFDFLHSRLQQIRVSGELVIYYELRHRLPF